MLRRAHTLVTRARERIRAAAEADPHGWAERDDDRAILVHDDVPPDPLPEPAADGEPPLGSPEPGAPDLEGPISRGGVSGPPAGGRPHRTGSTARRLTGAGREAPDAVPTALRIAASWSWRLIVVIVAVYALLY